MAHKAVIHFSRWLLLALIWTAQLPWYPGFYCLLSTMSELTNALKVNLQAVEQRIAELETQLLAAQSEIKTLRSQWKKHTDSLERHADSLKTSISEMVLQVSRTWSTSHSCRADIFTLLRWVLLQNFQENDLNRSTGSGKRR